MFFSSFLLIVRQNDIDVIFTFDYFAWNILFSHFVLKVLIYFFSRKTQKKCIWKLSTILDVLNLFKKCFHWWIQRTFPLIPLRNLVPSNWKFFEKESAQGVLSWILFPLLKNKSSFEMPEDYLNLKYQSLKFVFLIKLV